MKYSIWVGSPHSPQRGIAARGISVRVQAQDRPAGLQFSSEIEHSTKLAILIAWYRPHFGPEARNGEKMAEKWILAAPGKWEKNDRKMETLAKKRAKNANFPIFLPFSRRGQNPFFGHFFPISGRRPEMGSVPGNQDRNTKPLFLWGIPKGKMENFNRD